MTKRVAVVLCGSGYKDGSEIRESVGTLWALSQLPVQVKCFAPDSFQADVVNCLTGQVMEKEKRNQLVEAARIARGQVKPLSEFKSEDFDAIILPGGFGAAKNLCTFAIEGSQGKVIPELQSALEAMHRERKPIGAICIAPAVLALAFKEEKFELTLGPEGEAAEEVRKLGHKVVVCATDECIVDRKNKIVTTPAYMYDLAPLHHIFMGIQRLAEEVVAMA